MGDSYSAGNGAGTYYGPSGCYRSHGNYGELFTKLLNAPPYSQPTSFSNVACNGAVTAHFANSQNGQAPQYDGIKNSTDLVLLTIGGNDIGFKDIVIQCLVNLTNSGQKCEAALTAAETMIRNGTLRRRVNEVLQGIYSRADKNAKVVLLGYPYLIGDVGYTIAYKSGVKTITVQVGKRVQALSDSGEAIQSSLVTSLNATYTAYKPFTFVSTHKLFTGPPWHSLYASRTNPDRWMVDPNHASDKTLSKDTYYHPNPTGWQQEARLLLASAAVPKSKTQPMITNGDLPGGVVNHAYSATLKASDGRVGSWAVTSGSLPSGLTLKSSGVISGMPTTVGTKAVGFTFTDTLGTTVSATKKITIQPASPGWTVQQVGGSSNGLSQLTCGGNQCAAYILSGNGTEGYRSLLASQLNGGRWTITPAPLPGGLDSTAGSISNIACTQHGSCVATGSFRQTTQPGYNSEVVWINNGEGWTATTVSLAVGS